MPEVSSRREVVPVEDGTELQVSFFTQDSPGRTPVVLCMPAMGVEARYYAPFARELHREGLNVATCDLRGHGLSSVRAGRGTSFGYHEMVSRDWKAAVGAVRRSFPGSPLFLLGHSLGGQLSALYLGLDRESVQGLILVAACSVYYRGYGRAGLKVLVGSQLAGFTAKLWGYFPGHRLRFAGKEAAGVMQDWARQARTGRYQPAGATQDFEKLLGDIQHPVLAITVDGDWLAPPAAVEHLCQKMPRARLARWHYTPADAEGARLDHFRWVRHGAPVARRITAWMADLREDAERAARASSPGERPAHLSGGA